MGAAVTALSAGAADMSGWLLMGVPGAMYLAGISSSWIAIGLTIGAYLNYIIVAPRLRIYTEVAQNAITLPVFFENRFKNKNHLLKITSSIFILVFFTLYTSAGMVSGGKLFESAFGMDYTLGLLLTSVVVVLYLFRRISGGESYRFCTGNHYGAGIGDCTDCSHYPDWKYWRNFFTH
jgi:SSS family solute:Na+ symporter